MIPTTRYTCRYDAENGYCNLLQSNTPPCSRFSREILLQVSAAESLSGCASRVRARSFGRGGDARDDVYPEDTAWLNRSIDDAGDITAVPRREGVLESGNVF